MDKVIGGSIAIALIVGALLLMTFAWRARSRRASLIGHWPLLESDSVLSFEVFYVATTHHDRPLERVALRGFGYRSFAQIHIHRDGLALALTSGDTLVMPSTSLRRIHTERVAIDKAVERDGLVAFDWLSRDIGSGSIELTTFVRLRDAAQQKELIAVSSALVPTTTKEDVA